MITRDTLRKWIRFFIKCVYVSDCAILICSSRRMNTQCPFCSGGCGNRCVRTLNEMSRADRFAYLLESLGTCSESPTYYEDIVWLVQRIVQVSLSYV